MKTFLTSISLIFVMSATAQEYSNNLMLDMLNQQTKRESFVAQQNYQIGIHLEKAASLKNVSIITAVGGVILGSLITYAEVQAVNKYNAGQQNVLTRNTSISRPIVISGPIITGLCLSTSIGLSISGNSHLSKAAKLHKELSKIKIQ